MSDLVFVQPESDAERAERTGAIAERVIELIAELGRSGATRGEVMLSAEEAPPFGGKLVIDLDPGRAHESGWTRLGDAPPTSRGGR